MKIMHLAIAGLVLLGSGAHAERWYLAASNDRLKSYVDFDSFTTVGTMLRVQVLDIYPQGLGEGANTFAARVWEEVNCNSRTFRTLEYIFFGRGKKVQSVEPSASINEWKVPDPGSINESTVRVICTREGRGFEPDPYASVR
jgi:hypothetical protein